MNSPKESTVRVFMLGLLSLNLHAASISGVWTNNFDGLSKPNDIFLSSPAIAPDGTVYIAGGLPDSSHGNERRLYALNGANGDIQANWPVYLGIRLLTGSGLSKDRGIESTPAIGPDGMIYIGTWNTNILKINPSTRQITTYTPTGTQPKGILRTAPIVADGYVYCWVDGDPGATTPHPFLVILNASTMAYVGSWLDNGVYGDAIASPALGRDKKIYVATHFFPYPLTERSGRVYAIDVNVPSAPTKLWEYPTGCIGTVVASPIIGADGRLYVSTQNGFMDPSEHFGSVICFDPSNAQPQIPLWTCQTGGARPVDGTPAVGRTGEIYIANDLGGQSSSLSGFDPNIQSQESGLLTADWGDVEIVGARSSMPRPLSPQTKPCLQKASAHRLRWRLCGS
jgi:outer membrane protein assembly factor BamB